MALALPATGASAATDVVRNGTYSVGQDLEEQFFGDFSTPATAGAGSWQVTFSSDTYGVVSTAISAISRNLVAATTRPNGTIIPAVFTNLTMSWRNAADGTILSSRVMTPGENELDAVFSAPATLIQNLVYTWSSARTAATFEFEVEMYPNAVPVPLPAAGVLLLGGLGLLGLLRGRRGNKPA